MRKIGYRIERNRVVYFDWEKRNYNIFPLEKYSSHTEALMNEGYSDLSNYELEERIISCRSKVQNEEYPESPFAAYLEISSSCNMRCKHCFKAHVPYVDVISIEKLYNIIDELEAMGVFELRFVGYEPTTSPDLYDLMAYAKEKGFYLVLNTNGYLTDEEQNKILSYGFNEFLVSIDGNKEYHDMMRIDGSYKRAVSMVYKLGSLGIRTKINMTVNRDNITHMEELTKVASEANVNINFIPCRMIGNGERELDDSVVLDHMLMKQIAKQVHVLRQKYTNIIIYLTYHDYLDNKTVQYHKTIYSSTPCPAANNINIARNGQVYPCDLMSELGDEFCLGNIQETSIEDIWRHGKRIEKYRMLEKTERCTKCEKYGIQCSGGCFIERYLYNGRKFVDPLCYAHPLNQDGDYHEDRGSFYDADYYERGNETGKSLYDNYHYIPERSICDAKSILELYSLPVKGAIIDFGCANGFLMHTLIGMGIDTYGVEISAYAREHLMEGGQVVSSLSDLKERNYVLLVALSVFEHMTVNELRAVLEFSKAHGSDIIYTVPIALYEGGNYINPEFEKDASHLLRRPKNWWIKFVENYGYECIVSENSKLLHGKVGMMVAKCKLKK